LFSDILPKISSLNLSNESVLFLNCCQLCLFIEYLNNDCGKKSN
jgi:hypothetical protein